jgi:hypothetical protein
MSIEANPLAMLQVGGGQLLWIDLGGLTCFRTEPEMAYVLALQLYRILAWRSI